MDITARSGIPMGENPSAIASRLRKRNMSCSKTGITEKLQKEVSAEERVAVAKPVN